MPRKKSAMKAAQRFTKRVEDLQQFGYSINFSGLTKQEQTWAYEAALNKLAAGFEQLMLEALVAATNNDTTQVSEATSIKFPRHLIDEVCEYIVTGGGYSTSRARRADKAP